MSYVNLSDHPHLGTKCFRRGLMNGQRQHNLWEDDMSETTSNGPGGPANVTPSNSPERDARSATTQEQTTQQASDNRALGEVLSGDVDEIKQLANEQTLKAKIAAEQLATKEKNFAAQQLGGVATVLQNVGSELERSQQDSIGHYARKLGNSLQDFAHDMEDRDLGELAAMAEDFGRRQPVAFLSMAALAGFAASRFLTASAKRVKSDDLGSTVSSPSHDPRQSPYSTEERYSG
jgi:hypothetical protein